MASTVISSPFSKSKTESFPGSAMTMRPPFFIFTAGLTFPKAGYSVEVGPLEASAFLQAKRNQRTSGGRAWLG